MKVRLSIARKLGFGMGIIITFLAVLVVVVLSNSALNDNNDDSNKKSVKVNYQKSISLLHEMQAMVSNSKMLIKSWAFIEKKNNTPDKIKLRKLLDVDYPVIVDSIKTYTEMWDTSSAKLFDNTCITISDTIFSKHSQVMLALSTFESYDEMMNAFLIFPMVENDGIIIEKSNSVIDSLQVIAKKLGGLIVIEDQKAVQQAKIQQDEITRFREIIIILGVILVLAAIITAVIITRGMVKPINVLRQAIIDMGKGMLPSEKMKENNDEIGDMAGALNFLVDGLKSTSEFSKAIGEGNFENEFEPLSKQDELGNSLLNMRENLKTSADENARHKEEEEKRNWITTGLAQFGDILRQNNENVEDLSNNIISNLVKYIEANQGGLFVLSDGDGEERVLELKGAYAFNRQKYLNKSVLPGEGLVGSCFLEKESIYLTDIPHDYMDITSGLGDANPSFLLIVPLKIEDNVLGIIELASFKEIDSYVLEFIEKVGENIASSIMNVRTSMKTTQLLCQSQDQSERLAQQEEEMRQNLEEMQATQEESHRREKGLRQQLAAIEEGDNLPMDIDEEEEEF